MFPVHESVINPFAKTSFALTNAFIEKKIPYPQILIIYDFIIMIAT